MFDNKEKKRKTKRFVVKDSESMGLTGIQIIVDTQTGVNYLNTNGAAFSGLTPLLDSEGKVIVDPVEAENEE